LLEDWSLGAAAVAYKCDVVCCTLAVALITAAVLLAKSCIIVPSPHFQDSCFDERDIDGFLQKDTAVARPFIG